MNKKELMNYGYSYRIDPNATKRYQSDPLPRSSRFVRTHKENNVIEEQEDMLLTSMLSYSSVSSSDEVDTSYGKDTGYCTEDNCLVHSETTNCLKRISEDGDASEYQRALKHCFNPGDDLHVRFCLKHILFRPVIEIPISTFQDVKKNLQYVGRGAFGTVYKYEDSVMGYSVALKCMPILFKESEQELINDAIKEVEIQRKFVHENIVQYIGHYQSADNIFIVLEYMENGSLKEKLDQLKGRPEPVLPCSDIIFYVRDICNGLRALHRQKIIHRDIRSANILLSLSGSAKIGDFGISYEFLATKSHLNTTDAGNGYWHAPELIDVSRCKESIGRKVDVWSLGVTILEMIHIVPPFMKGGKAGLMPFMFQLCYNKVVPAIPECVSDDIKLVLTKCLAFQVEDRSTSDELFNECFKQG